MKAKLQGFYCLDIDIPLSEYRPLDLDNFGFNARIIVGEEILGGEESFDFIICTPKWLMNKYAPKDIVLGIHYLIVFEFNYPKIYEWIKKFVENTKGDTWEEIALKICNLGYWEFDNYQPYI